MRKILCLLLILPFLSNCDGGTVNNNNPNIPNYGVNLQINTDLPSYTNLRYPGNFIVDYSQGARGIVVLNTGSGYNAFDLACPNQSYNTCTNPMTVKGTQATCTCDNAIYNLYSGQAPGQKYPMKAYRTTVDGSLITVYN